MAELKVILHNEENADLFPKTFGEIVFNKTTDGNEYNLSGVEKDAQVNKIEVVKVNGVALEIADADKSVDIIPDEYEIAEGTVEATDVAAYELKKGDEVAGETIKIPKNDMEITDGEESDTFEKKYTFKQGADTFGEVEIPKGQYKIAKVEDASIAATSEAEYKLMNGTADVTGSVNVVIPKADYSVTSEDDEANNAVKYTLTKNDEAVSGAAVISVPNREEYTIAKKTDAEEGYFATYVLKKDGEEVSGSSINIPKDFLVKSASIKKGSECVPAQEPADDLFIDFVVNVKEGSATDEHIFLNVNQLVDAYTGGDYVSISETNEIDIDPTKIANDMLIETGTRLTTEGVVYANAELKANKETALSDAADDDHYPSSKAVVAYAEDKSNKEALDMDAATAPTDTNLYPTLVSVYNAVKDISLEAGDGIDIDDDNKINVNITENKGLALAGTAGAKTLEVVAGNGIEVGTNGVAVKAEENKGLAVGADGVSVKVNENKGISVDENGIYAKLKANGGLTVTSDGVEVVAATTTAIGGIKSGSADGEIVVGTDGIAKVKGGITYTEIPTP